MTWAHEHVTTVVFSSVSSDGACGFNLCDVVRRRGSWESRGLLPIWVSLLVLLPAPDDDLMLMLMCSMLMFIVAQVCEMVERV